LEGVGDKVGLGKKKESLPSSRGEKGFCTNEKKKEFVLSSKRGGRSVRGPEGGGFALGGDYASRWLHFSVLFFFLLGGAFFWGNARATDEISSGGAEKRRSLFHRCKKHNTKRAIIFLLSLFWRGKEGGKKKGPICKRGHVGFFLGEILQ